MMQVIYETNTLKSRRRNVLEKLPSLAKNVFNKRAEEYDRSSKFPLDNFDDLFDIGALALPVDPVLGGLGWAPDYGHVDSLWKMTRAIANVDLSFSRCWEGHNNALMLIDKLATLTQKKRWFSEVIEKGVRWAAWSGEPQKLTPGQKYSIGTKIEKVSGGYVIRGNKVFATSATGANWAILLVSLAGPGGARDAGDGENSLLMLACDLSDSSISFDSSWWDPIGMRSTSSYKVNFDNTFIPEENCIGHIGEYLTLGMQSCFTPHYAISFLGALEAAYEYALKTVHSQNRESDPYVQHHIAEIKLNIETLDLWSDCVAKKLNQFDQVGVGIAANKFRYLSQQLAEEGVRKCIQICGARSLNKPAHLERILRDLTIYVQHDNADHILSTIGKNELGLKADKSFFKLKA